MRGGNVYYGAGDGDGARRNKALVRDRRSGVVRCQMRLGSVVGRGHTFQSQGVASRAGAGAGARSRNSRH